MNFFASSLAAAVSALNHSLFLVLNPGPLPGGDAPILVALARFASTWLPELLLGLLFAALLLGPRVHVLRQRVLIVLGAMLLAWLAARVLQALWPQPRPFMLGLGTPWLSHAASASFPSMHASVAAAWAAALAHWRKPVLSWVAAGLALLIAWSRMALGLHFPADVLAGVVLGVGAARFTHLCLSPVRLRWLQCVGRRAVRRQWARRWRLQRPA